jgi:hypothetical protein
MGTAAHAIASLEYAIKVVDQLGRLPERLAVAAAPKITELQKAQFDAGVDPYGQAWKALARRTLAKGRRPPPLTDKRRLRNGTGTWPLVGHRLLHRVNAPYGIHHQYGAPRANLSQRMILPTKGLPPAWRRILDEQAKILARRAA